MATPDGAGSEHPAMSERERNRKCLLRLLQRQHNFPLSPRVAPQRCHKNLAELCCACTALVRVAVGGGGQQKGRIGVDGVGCEIFSWIGLAAGQKDQTASWRLAHG